MKLQGPTTMRNMALQQHRHFWKHGRAASLKSYQEFGPGYYTTQGQAENPHVRPGPSAVDAINPSQR